MTLYHLYCILPDWRHPDWLLRIEWLFPIHVHSTSSDILWCASLRTCYKNNGETWIFLIMHMSCVSLQDLLYSLPLFVTLLLVVGIGMIIACVMYRARRGYFCCLKPVSCSTHADYAVCHFLSRNWSPLLMMCSCKCGYVCVVMYVWLCASHLFYFKLIISRMIC